jgi:hypothetical protein
VTRLFGAHDRPHRVEQARMSSRVSSGKSDRMLIFAHPKREIRQDIRYRDPHAANRWLTASLPRLNGDDVLVRHVSILPAARAVGLTDQTFSRGPVPRDWHAHRAR